MRVYGPEADLMDRYFASIFGYTSVKSSVKNLLPALSSDRINVIYVSSSRALDLQWWTQLDHVAEIVRGVEIGGIVFSKKRLDRLLRHWPLSTYFRDDSFGKPVWLHGELKGQLGFRVLHERVEFGLGLEE